MSNRVQVVTNTLEQIRKLILPACQKAVQEFFDDNYTNVYELASAIEAEVVKEYQSNPTREEVIDTVVDCGHLTVVGHIRKMIEGIPDDRRVITQLLGQQSGVWNMFLTGAILNKGNGMVVMSTGHPELDHLPGGRDSDERNLIINKMIEELNNLR